MKREYVEPQLEVIQMSKVDMLSTSNGNFDVNWGDTDWETELNGGGANV